MVGAGRAVPAFVSDAGKPQATARGWLRLAVVVAAAVAVGAGVVLRFYCPSPLWLDEAISVNISRLPISQIPGALRQDGAPPLYYVLLHYWMLLFGQGDAAVRAFSGVTSVVTMPLFWYAGRRLGGRIVAWIAFFLGTTSPFAIYYATSARMYSLMILGTLLGFLALYRAIEHPSAGRLVALGAVTAVVIYTHYWGLYLLAVTGAGLLYQWWRHRRGLPARSDRRTLARCLLAMLVGSLLFLPWAPTFVFQALHTGTPWTSAARPAALLGIFADLSGTGSWAQLAALAYTALILLGIFGCRRGRSGSGAPISLQLNQRALPTFGVVAGTLALAVVAGAIAHAAFVARYTAVVLPLFLLLVALGIELLPRPRWAGATLGILCLAGLLTGIGNNGELRTQAARVANVLNAKAQPGDLVLFCPDQLGPDVNRLVSVPGVTQLTFPRAIGPQRIDWINYRAAIERTNVETFAQDMLARAEPGRAIWLVWSSAYPGFGNDCGDLAGWLSSLDGPAVTLLQSGGSSTYRAVNVVRYPSKTTTETGL